MQKKLIYLTNIAIVLAAFVVLLQPSLVQAQELPKALISQAGQFIAINQPGLYGVESEKPFNTLLIPVHPQDRWNVLYQQNPETTVMLGIHFSNDLHVYVAQLDNPLASSVSANVAPVVTEPEASASAEISTSSASIKPSVKGVAEDKLVEKPAITIDKSAQSATPAAVPPATPTPTPVAKPAAALEPSALDGLFDKYAQEYGLSATVLKHIAKCESGLRPEALSSNGLYGGLFQFVAGTWSSNRKAMGLDPDPALRFNAEEAIKTAAFKISRDGIGAWPVCGKKATAGTVASI